VGETFHSQQTGKALKLTLQCFPGKNNLGDPTHGPQGWEAVPQWEPVLGGGGGRKKANAQALQDAFAKMRP